MPYSEKRFHALVERVDGIDAKVAELHGVPNGQADPVLVKEPAIWRKVLMWVVHSLVGNALVVFGTAVSILTIWPRLTVTAVIDTATPMESSFVISNDGLFPVSQVRTQCLLGDIDTRSGAMEHVPKEKGQFGPTTFTNMQIPIVDLDPGAKEVVPFRDCFTPADPKALRMAHVGMRVTYRPLFWFGDRSFTQEFYAQRSQIGDFFWYTVPYYEHEEYLHKQ